MCRMLEMLEKKMQIMSSLWTTTTTIKTTTNTTTYLHKVGEGDADHEQFVDNPKQVWISEHAVLEATVEKVHVIRQNIIHVWHLNNTNNNYKHQQPTDDYCYYYYYNINI